MSPEAAPAAAAVLNSGFIGQGPVVEKFETQLKNRFGTDNLVTTNSGTSAEHLAFRLLGLAPDTEVLTTALTCTATNVPVLANGLRLKWVDVNPLTLNMDLEDLERKITQHTRVIYLTHWGGYPNDLDRVSRIVQKTVDTFGFRPYVIEDCAHAWGSEYMGKLIGTHGNICTFSFQAIKHLTSVDGGMLVSPHMEEFYRRAKLLRWYGIDREQQRNDFRCEADVAEWGYKFHMNDVCAAVGLANLENVDAVVQSHKGNAGYYDVNLQGITGLKVPPREIGFDSAFWIYSMLVDDRAGFTKWMKQCGIAVSQVHERNDKHSCFREYKTHLPALDGVIGKLTHIPVGWWVSREDREYIVSCIKRGW